MLQHFMLITLDIILLWHGKLGNYLPLPSPADVVILQQLSFIVLVLPPRELNISCLYSKRIELEDRWVTLE